MSERVVRLPRVPGNRISAYKKSDFGLRTLPSRVNRAIHGLEGVVNQVADSARRSQEPKRRPGAVRKETAGYRAVRGLRALGLAFIVTAGGIGGVKMIDTVAGTDLIGAGQAAIEVKQADWRYKDALAERGNRETRWSPETRWKGVAQIDDDIRKIQAERTAAADRFHAGTKNVFRKTG